MLQIEILSKPLKYSFKSFLILCFFDIVQLCIFKCKMAAQSVITLNCMA